jgi:hypothetical protein
VEVELGHLSIMERSIMEMKVYSAGVSRTDKFSFISIMEVGSSIDECNKIEI